MDRKRKLPTAADFFGVEGPEDKTTERAARGEDILAKTMDEEEEEAAAPTTRRGPRLTKEVLMQGTDEEFAAAIEAEKAAVSAAFEPKPQIVPRRAGEKVTFYLPTAMLKQLEVVKLQLLLEHNWKLSRSQIVQALLEGMQEKVGEIAEWAEGE